MTPHKNSTGRFNADQTAAREKKERVRNAMPNNIGERTFTNLFFFLLACRAHL
jgi:hypothetical protein